MNVLITGANGFLGSRIAMTLSARVGVNLTAAVRRSVQLPAMCVFEAQSLDINTDWSTCLSDQQVVIHTAARVHVMKEDLRDALQEYRRVNVEGTLKLARQAAAAGVKRFIFISSLKVNGESTPIYQPFTADAGPAPEDAYGVSKLEAELGLEQLANQTEMELVIIRPPLVYGPNVKGNFARLINYVKKGMPLPFGDIKNKRSLIALDNLVDLIICCIDHPAAANQVFLAADGHDLSTTELFREVARAAGVPSYLVPIPSSLLMFGASMLGQKVVGQKLLGSLQVDIGKARDLLGWSPPVTVDVGLHRCLEDRDRRQ